MEINRKLEGRTILLIQHEELCAMIITEALQEAGARVVACSTPEEALKALAAGGIAAAVVDHAVCDGDDVCRQMNDTNVPFVLHNGLIEVHGRRSGPPAKALKPASADSIVGEIEKLVSPT